MSWIGERGGRAVAFVATFLGGALVGSIGTSEMSAAVAPQTAPPAYLIGITNVPEAGVLSAYSAAAGPSAMRAGLAAMARSTEVEVLEGAWPFEGRRVLLERFTSMQELRDFWYSPEYQEAKKLRVGLLDVDFFVAVEGLAP